MSMPESIRAFIGWSQKADPFRAGKEAAEHAREQGAFPGAQLAIVFGSSWFDQPSLLQGVRSVLGKTPVVGESTAGEIVPEGTKSHSCVVVLISAVSQLWSVGVGEAVDLKPRETGQQAAYAAVQQLKVTPRNGFLLFGDGLVTSYAEVVRGIQEVLGTGSVIAGGMAGDDLRFSQTFQYANDRVLTRAVVGVLFGGALRISAALHHGFSPISRPHRITRANANVLYELDGLSAASVYEEYVGTDVVSRMRRDGLTRQGIAYPLGIQGETQHQWLLRNIVSFGADGSLSCSGEVPQDAWLQLMIGSRDLALEAAQKAARQAIQPLNHIACVLVFDSIVRRTLLGAQHAEREIAQIRETVGASIPLAGCYTYGEQAPWGEASAINRTAVQTSSVLVVALGT